MSLLLNLRGDREEVFCYFLLSPLRARKKVRIAITLWNIENKPLTNVKNWHKKIKKLRGISFDIAKLEERYLCICGTKEKSPKMLSQYWINLDNEPKIILHFGSTNIFFAGCTMFIIFFRKYFSCCPRFFIYIFITQRIYIS